MMRRRRAQRPVKIKPVAPDGPVAPHVAVATAAKLANEANAAEAASAPPRPIVRQEMTPRLRDLTMSDVLNLSMSDRLACYLGPDFNRMVITVLLDLGRARESASEDIAAQAILGDLTQSLTELESAARQARRDLDKVLDRRRMFHRLRTERTARDAAREVEAAAKREADEAAKASHAERLARLRGCIEANGLVLEADPNAPTESGRLRVVTTNLHHRLVPDRFGNPEGWRNLHRIIRGAVLHVELPESGGSIGHVERWAAHHLGFVAEPANGTAAHENAGGGER